MPDTLVLSADDVRRVLPVRECIDVMRDAFVALAEGRLDDAKPRLEDAVDLYGHAPAPYERAHARLDLARTLRALGERVVNGLEHESPLVDPARVVAIAPGRRDRSRPADDRAQRLAGATARITAPATSEVTAAITRRAIFIGRVNSIACSTCT